MLEYNTIDGAKRRKRAKPLTLAEELEVMNLLNVRITGCFKIKISKKGESLIQRFIDHYQNLNHYRAYSEGLWCTDRKELAKHKDFFQLKFK